MVAVEVAISAVVRVLRARETIVIERARGRIPVLVLDDMHLRKVVKYREV